MNDDKKNNAYTEAKKEKQQLYNKGGVVGSKG